MFNSIMLIGSLHPDESTEDCLFIHYYLVTYNIFWLNQTILSYPIMAHMIHYIINMDYTVHLRYKYNSQTLNAASLCAPIAFRRQAL